LGKIASYIFARSVTYPRSKKKDGTRVPRKILLREKTYEEHENDHDPLRHSVVCFGRTGGGKKYQTRIVRESNLGLGWGRAGPAPVDYHHHLLPDHDNYFPGSGVCPWHHERGRKKWLAVRP
jgi:hypothetical protein